MERKMLFPDYLREKTVGVDSTRSELSSSLIFFLSMDA